MKCKDCEKTDGLIYTSFPPKVRCFVTGKYHSYDDECDVKIECQECGCEDNTFAMELYIPKNLCNTFYSYEN